MSTRNEFSGTTKAALAERAGHRCSYPGCKASTIGPSEEGTTATSNTGMACHIAAAAGGPGARRYVSGMTKEQRSAIENGIWMCYTHGKLIDTDEKRFSIEMLQKWRRFAELRARVTQELGRDIERSIDQLRTIGFAEETILLKSLGHENRVIGSALLDSCVRLVWGKDLADSTRDFLIEIVRNAFVHGGATECTIRIRPNAIYVDDNGLEFDSFSLNSYSSVSGGSEAVKHLISCFSGRLVLGSKRRGTLNHTMIALATTGEDIFLAEECCSIIKDKDLKSIKRGSLPLDLFNEEQLKACHVLYVIVPHFVSPSDTIFLIAAIPAEPLKNKQLVFVTLNASLWVRHALAAAFQNARVVDVDSW